MSARVHVLLGDSHISVASTRLEKVPCQNFLRRGVPKHDQRPHSASGGPSRVPDYFFMPYSAAHSAVLKTYSTPFSVIMPRFRLNFHLFLTRFTCLAIDKGSQRPPTSREPEDCIPYQTGTARGCLSRCRQHHRHRRHLKSESARKNVRCMTKIACETPHFCAPDPSGGSSSSTAGAVMRSSQSDTTHRSHCNSGGTHQWALVQLQALLAPCVSVAVGATCKSS